MKAEQHLLQSLTCGAKIPHCISEKRTRIRERKYTNDK